MSPKASSKGSSTATWECPTCRRRFAKAHQWHSCETKKLEEHFRGRDPELRGIFDELVRRLRKLGPVEVDPVNALAVLADGMGGYNAGEVASTMATSFIKTELGRWLHEAAGHATDTEVRRAMDICVDNANRAILNAANANPQYAGMGTTLIVAVFREGQLRLGHVGDSRAYRMRGGQLVQITRDHSLLQEQIDAGLITPEQAAFSANKNLVTRAVGVEDTVLLETHLHEVQPGDLYLMCSDGLSDMLDNATLAQLLQTHDELPTAGRALIDAANDAGGKDNIALVLVRVAGNPAANAKPWWRFGR